MAATKSDCKDFAARLNQACDDSGIVPALGKGRQVYIASVMKVSQEAARKWLSGEAMPKSDKIKRLAAMLEVDEVYLHLGIKPEMSRDQKKQFARFRSGAINMVAGAIDIAGGKAAFPREGDPRGEYVDIYAWLGGEKVDLRVCTARELESGAFELIVPRQYTDVRCIGFFVDRGTVFKMIDLSVSLIEKHKQPKAGDFVVMVERKDGAFVTGDDEWPKLKTILGVV